MTRLNAHRYFSVVLTGFLVMSSGLTLSGCSWNPFAPKATTVTETPASPISVSSETISVFFSRKRGSSGKIEDVSRSLPDAEKQEPVRFAVNELLKGPTSQERKNGFYSEIPSGTALRGINRKDGNIIVDLSDAFASGGGSTSVTQRVEELKRTVYAVDNRHELIVAVNGKPLETLGGEGLEIPETVKRDIQ